MAEENLKVAVRVRPFNKREIDAKSSLIVSMSGNQTIITNPKTNDEKKYAYDFSYWSHDGFTTSDDGYFLPENPKYADQKRVFDDLGEGVLANAWEGFNASLFAYGQTGSGKSYSVVGYGSNKGIVPMVCEDIFNKSESKKTAGINIEVTFSMLEIYSEVVRDLLNPSSNRKSGLTVREDPKIGFYPQNLTKKLVDDFSDIVHLMDEGTANRTIAATNMNATSSRAHTIVTINLVQKYFNEAGKEIAKSSMINLVDLAGSERADATGATGDRLKEGAAINLSLTSLGNVISALADNSSGKNVRVPYRDSVLTKLLMNALGGNSKTIMIAAISPADINYDESVSTLRYADRAKQIKTKAIVNEDPTEKLIKDLKEENLRLKKMLESGKIDPELMNQLTVTGKKEENEDEILKQQLEENDRKMKEMELSYEEKLREAKNSIQNSEQSQKLAKAKTTPHLSNINMDPSLSGTLIFLLDGDGDKKIGLPGNSDIPLQGIDILPAHAIITSDSERFILSRINESRILINGEILDSSTELIHLDRLLFGASQYYCFIDPSKSNPNDIIYSFEMVQDEIAKKSGLISDENKLNLNQEQIKCQNELLELLPHIEEANSISAILDKKVSFNAFPVSAAARGDYDGEMKPFISVRNFETGLNWTWTKEKFLDRKAEITELYLDFQDDGKINSEKYQSYDPFYESPDTPTQIGTAMIYPKLLPFLIAYKNEVKILDLKSNEVGTLEIEIIPCDNNWEPLDGEIEISDPNVQLLNQTINFVFTIGSAKISNPIYEDIFCVFKMYKDPKEYKSEVIHRSSSFEFNFSQDCSLTINQDRLDFLLNKCLYVQIFGEQKHPVKNLNKNVSTRDYLNKDKYNSNRRLLGKVSNKVDPEAEKLKEDLRLASIRQNRSDYSNKNVRRLLQASGGAPIDAKYLNKMLKASSDSEADQILDEYLKDKNSGTNGNGQFEMNLFGQLEDPFRMAERIQRDTLNMHKKHMEMHTKTRERIEKNREESQRNHMKMVYSNMRMTQINNGMTPDDQMINNYHHGSQACILS